MYSGTLQYDGEEDYIHVRRFIERETEASIDLTTTWGDLGVWSVDTRMFKTLTGYESQFIYPKNRAGKPDSTTAKIALCIVDRSPSRLTITGTWTQAGDDYTFGGELMIAG